MSLIDLTVQWSTSPRVISMPTSLFAFTIQDLVDTLRTEAARLENAGYKPLIRASGKQSLTSSLLVGITCTLLDATLFFPTPIGPNERYDMQGGNLLAVDDLDVAVNPISVSQHTQVVYDLSPTPTINVGGAAGSSRGYVIIQG